MNTVKINMNEAKTFVSASKKVNKKTSIFMLRNIHFKADDQGRGYMLFTDLDSWIKLDTAEFEGASDFLLDFKTFEAVVKSAPKAESVTVTEVTGTAFIYVDGVKACQAHAFAGDDFPPVPEFEAVNSFSLDVKEVKEAKVVTEFSANNVTRACLCGAAVHVVDGRAKFCATDGHFLKVSGSVEHRAEDVIMKSDAIEIAAAVKTAVDFAFNEYYTVGTFGNGFAFYVKNVEGPYPKVSSVIPTMFENEVTFDVKELESAVESAKLAANQRTKAIKVVYDEDKREFSLHAHDNERGVSADVHLYYGISDGVHNGISFNACMLSKILKSRKKGFDTVKLRYNGELNASLWDFGDGTTNLLMPCRLED